MEQERHGLSVKRLFYRLALLAFRLRPLRLSFARNPGTKPTIWTEVGRASESIRITGVERVSRQVSKELQSLGHGTPLHNTKFFRIDAFGRAIEVPSDWFNSDSNEAFPSARVVVFRPGDLIFLLDLSLPPSGLNLRERNLLKSNGVQLCTLVYDVLPLSHPELFHRNKVLVFHEWLRVAAQSDFLVFISRTSRAAFHECSSKLSLDNLRAEHVLPMGPLEDSASQFQREGSSSSNASCGLRLLAVGTLEPRKDYSGLLDSLEILWNQGLRVHLTIVGRIGWLSDGLCHRIANLQASYQQLDWLSDASDEALRNAMLRSDFLIANSIAEGFGLPLIEAKSLGTDVIARDIPSFREAVPDAIFFEGGSPRILAQKIKEVLGSRATVDQKKGAMAAQQTSSWAQSVSELVEFLVHGFEQKSDSNLPPLADSEPATRSFPSSSEI